MSIPLSTQMRCKILGIKIACDNCKHYDPDAHVRFVDSCAIYSDLKQSPGYVDYLTENGERRYYCDEFDPRALQTLIT